MEEHQRVALLGAAVREAARAEIRCATAPGRNARTECFRKSRSSIVGPGLGRLGGTQQA